MFDEGLAAYGREEEGYIQEVAGFLMPAQSTAPTTSLRAEATSLVTGAAMGTDAALRPATTTSSAGPAGAAPVGGTVGRRSATSSTTGSSSVTSRDYSTPSTTAPRLVPRYVPSAGTTASTTTSAAQTEVSPAGGTVKAARTSAAGGASTASTATPSPKAEVVFVPDVVQGPPPPGAIAADGSQPQQAGGGGGDQPPPPPSSGRQAAEAPLVPAPATAESGGMGLVTLAAVAMFAWFFWKGGK